MVSGAVVKASLAVGVKGPENVGRESETIPLTEREAPERHL